MRRRWLVGTKVEFTSSGTFARNASQQIRADSCPSPCEQTTSATFAAGSVSVSVMASAHPPLGLLLRSVLRTRRILRPTWDVYASCVESQYNPSGPAARWNVLLSLVRDVYWSRLALKVCSCSF